jgi:hypothetical protein
LNTVHYSAYGHEDEPFLTRCLSELDILDRTVVLGLEFKLEAPQKLYFKPGNGEEKKMLFLAENYDVLFLIVVD